ncbi:hypothetical protein QQ045_030161 [Rhodiola kirilowii]
MVKECYLADPFSLCLANTQYFVTTSVLFIEADYPYKANDGKCDTYRKNARVVSIDGYEDVLVNSESALQKAVANQPIAGVFTGTCGTALDHGVVAVEYGTDNGKDYWIVRNSWGSSWGKMATSAWNAMWLVLPLTNMK